MTGVRDQWTPEEDCEIPGLWWVGDENFPTEALAASYAAQMRAEAAVDAMFGQ